MNTTLALYLFVKSDDFKSILTNDYSLVPLTFVVTAIVCVASLLMNCTDGACNIINEKASEWVDSYIKQSAKYLLLSAFLCFFLNVMAIILPSTGQMAAIYIGATALESDTMDVLSRLPKKYATLLDTKADEWLSEQVKNLEEELAE